MVVEKVLNSLKPFLLQSRNVVLFVAAIVGFVSLFSVMGFAKLPDRRPSIAVHIDDIKPAQGTVGRASRYFVSEFSATSRPSVVEAAYKPWVDTYLEPRKKTRGLIAEADTYDKELKCLTEAIYHEARGEGVTGRFAVAEVVINRKNDDRYPDTICGVVYQGRLDGLDANRLLGCQFSFTCDGSLKRRIDRKHWKDSQDLAEVVLHGFGTELTADATHYHATYVRPYWAPTLKRTAKIGKHVFYRWGSRRPH